MKENVERKKIGVALLSMALLMIALLGILAIGGSSAETGIAYPITGYILDGEGSPVVDATVTCEGQTASSGATGWYQIDGSGIDLIEGETLTLNAVKIGVGIGSAPHTVDFGSFVETNITLSEATISLFDLTVWAVDQNGNGVENVSISMFDGTTYTNLTTNETGYAIFNLGIGNYSYSAILPAGAVNLTNQTGNISIVDRAVSLVIDLSVIPEPTGLTILGLDMGPYCYAFFGLAVVAGMLGLLVLVVNRGEKIGGLGDRGFGSLVILSGFMAVMVLFMLFLTIWGSLMAWLSGGFSLGVIGRGTSVVGVLAIFCQIVIASLLVSMGWIAIRGKVSPWWGQPYAFGLVGIFGVAMLLVPGFPLLSLLGVIIGGVMLVIAVVLYFTKAGRPVSSQMMLAIGLVLEVVALIELYNVVRLGGGILG